MIQREDLKATPLILLFVFSFIFFWVSSLSLFGQDNSNEKPSNNKNVGGSFILSELLSYDYIDGYMDALTSQTNISFQMGNYINIDTLIHLDLTSGLYRNVQFRYTIKPIPYFHVEIGYLIRDFPEFKIAEHNLIGFCHLIIPVKNFLKMRASFGINTRFVDLDTRVNDVGLNENWLRTNIIIWETSIIFKPHKIYSTELKIGNLSFNEVVSDGYFQIENLNRVEISPRITILTNIGFALAGSGSIAGIPNRFWVTGGIEYEIPF